MNDRFNHLPPLPTGQKVYLTIPNIDDKEEFLLSVNDSIDFHNPWVQAPRTEEQFERYIGRINFTSHIGFFVKCLANDKLAGVININEILSGAFQSGYLGFYAFKALSGQGLMSEGLSLVMDFYFNTFNYHRLEANIQPDNIKSIRLIKSKHFRHEGFSPKYLKILGEWRDHERFAMTQENYNGDN